MWNLVLLFQRFSQHSRTLLSAELTRFRQHQWTRSVCTVQCKCFAHKERRRTFGLVRKPPPFLQFRCRNISLTDLPGTVLKSALSCTSSRDQRHFLLSYFLLRDRHQVGKSNFDTGVGTSPCVICYERVTLVLRVPKGVVPRFLLYFDSTVNEVHNVFRFVLFTPNSCGRTVL